MRIAEWLQSTWLSSSGRRKKRVIRTCLPKEATPEDCIHESSSDIIDIRQSGNGFSTEAHRRKRDNTGKIAIICCIDVHLSNNVEWKTELGNDLLQNLQSNITQCAIVTRIQNDAAKSIAYCSSFAESPRERV